MLLIKNFLTADKLAELKNTLATAPYIDGRSTVGAAGQSIKLNLQVREDHPSYAQANQIVREAIVRSEQLQTYAYPRIVTPIRFSKYGPGMSYGDHFDAALMPLLNTVLRTDLSFTLFISPPQSYEGGELVVDLDGDEKAIKANAGDMFLYPSGRRHRVNTVLNGCREVAVGWIQSVYSMPEQRQILANISAVRYQILTEKGKCNEFDKLNQAYITLERMWATL